jgi:hypothetical protein
VLSPDEYDLAVIYVDYLDSGVGYPAPPDPPYDHGYYQALDAIRALHYVDSGLQKEGIEFDTGRLYGTGGSGGGNVSLMANKLAPRTFACVVDLSGMASLTDDIAFNIPGGSELKAGYSRDPAAPNYLSKDAQLIRDPGHPEHLAVMKNLGCTSMVVSIHGETDHDCLDDKKRVLGNMETAKLRVDPHIITQSDVDGNLIKDTGHSLGDRTRLFGHFAGKYVLPKSADMCRREGKNDFELRDEEVVYPTPNGRYVISYKGGYPVGRFEQTQKQHGATSCDP